MKKKNKDIINESYKVIEDFFNSLIPLLTLIFAGFGMFAYFILNKVDIFSAISVTIIFIVFASIRLFGVMPFFFRMEKK